MSPGRHLPDLLNLALGKRLIRVSLAIDLGEQVVSPGSRSLEKSLVSNEVDLEGRGVGDGGRRIKTLLQTRRMRRFVKRTPGNSQRYADVAGAHCNQSSNRCGL